MLVRILKARSGVRSAIVQRLPNPLRRKWLQRRHRQDAEFLYLASRTQVLTPEIMPIGSRLVGSFAATPVELKKDELDECTMTSLRESFPLEDRAASFVYRPKSVFGAEVEGITLVRTDKSLAAATRFAAVDTQLRIIGPYIRQNGTALDRPKATGRTVEESLAQERGSGQALRVDFALPMLEAGRNFGHFLVSHLPKLRHWLSLYRLGAGPKLLLDGFRPWQAEILTLLGVPRSNIVEVSQQDARIYVERYCWTDEKYLGGSSPSFCSENLEWLRVVCQNATVGAVGAMSKLVYLEREPTARRVVTNTDTVRECIARFGGSTFRPAEMTVREQWLAVQSADVLVATNGTEALHAIFSPAKHVICFVPPGPHHFAVVTALILAMGKRFIPIYDLSQVPSKVPADLRDIHADVKALGAVLSTLT